MADKHTQFVELLLRHQRQIYTYIFSLVPNHSDAEDIQQQTSVVLWEKFDEFEPGTDFAAWAQRTAYFQVLAHRQKHRRDRLRFSDAALELLSATSEKGEAAASAVSSALRRCLESLRSDERDLLIDRYETDANLNQIAEARSVPVATLYTRLKRIRGRLYRCITSRLAREARR